MILIGLKDQNGDTAMVNPESVDLLNASEFLDVETGDFVDGTIISTRGGDKVTVRGSPEQVVSLLLEPKA